MAEYQLTRDEYENLLDRPPSIRAPWARRGLRFSLVLVALILFALVVYFRQWLFAAAAAGLMIVAFKFGPRWDRADFEKDPFKSARVQVQILPEVVTFRSGATHAEFPFSELSCLLEYPRCFVVRHQSGLQVRVPRSALTEHELSVLVGLQRALPAVAKKMYTT